jgi:glycosyltransferase involved in cell wall biosynthesis
MSLADSERYPMKKNIIMLAENPIPASKRVSRPHYVAQALAKYGFDVRTITFQAEETRSIPGCRHLYLPFHFGQFNIVKRVSFLISFAYVIKEIFKIRPSVLHGQGFLPGLVIVLCSRIFNIPCIVGMPDFVETLYESFKFPLVSLGTKILIKLENIMVQRVDALIVESELAKAEWSKRGIDIRKIYPIHHAADISLFNPRIKGDKIRDTYSIGDNLLITYHGDIGSDDGVDILIRAFQIITDKFPNTRLMIIGSGTQTTIDALKTLSSELGGRVIFTGWISYQEIPKYIAASDIGVAPFRSTLYTNTVVPTKVLEIMAMEKPAVVSDLTTFSKYVSHEQNCLLVRPGSVDGLSSALAQLITNAELSKRLGKSGRKLVEEKFTWTVKANQEVRIIRNIIK